MSNANILLDVQDLKTFFNTDEGIARAVNGVSFHINRGEILGVVGESGCGKSVTALSMLQLIPRPPGKIVGGKILYYERQDGSQPMDIVSLSPHSRKMRDIRGSQISMIFQEPMTSFSPFYTIGQQIVEALQLHESLDRRQAKAKAVEMLAMVGISEPKLRSDEYPHKFSGGMLQRAMIALALSCNPQLLIADEPTTALDVTIEAQILGLLRDLQKDLGLSIMMITHDLGVIADIAERIIVMYAGKVVESADVDSIFYRPKHPYTQGLLKLVPKIGTKGRLVPIPGNVPRLTDDLKGCYFSQRCPHAMEICRTDDPPNILIDTDHETSCWLYKEHIKEDSLV